MDPKKLEKFILDGRSNKMSDTQIIAQLLAGGWNVDDIDKAFKSLSPNRSSRIEAKSSDFEIKEPVFLPTFLGFFVVLLIFLNFASYFGQLTGNPSATPVSNGELFGNLLFSAIGGAVLAFLYMLLKKLIHKLRNR